MKKKPNITTPDLEQSQIKNQKSKILRLPPEFEGLCPVQLDYINDQLREHTYADVQRMLFTEYGIHISINKLFRYYKKLELAEQLEISEDSNESVQQLLNLYNGQPVDIDKAGLETLTRRALELAVSPKTKPSMLLNLMRIFTWEHRKSMDEDRKAMNAHRKQMDLDKAAHRNRMAEIAERRAKCEEDRVKLLERRQTHDEKLKPAKVPEMPQEMLTRIIEEELAKPWQGPLPHLRNTHEPTNTTTG